MADSLVVNGIVNFCQWIIYVLKVPGTCTLHSHCVIRVPRLYFLYVLRIYILYTFTTNKYNECSEQSKVYVQYTKNVCI